MEKNIQMIAMSKKAKLKCLFAAMWICADIWIRNKFSRQKSNKPIPGSP